VSEVHARTDTDLKDFTLRKRHNPFANFANPGWVTQLTYEMGIDVISVAAVSFDLGLTEEAEALWRRALPICERTWEAEDPRLALILFDLGAAAAQDRQKVRGTEAAGSGNSFRIGKKD
jgi:hypothetical protein